MLVSENDLNDAMVVRQRQTQRHWWHIVLENAISVFLFAKLVGAFCYIYLRFLHVTTKHVASTKYTNGINAP